MGIVKLVQNGDKTATFKAVPLSIAVAILFGLLSIIGAQQTWLWAGAHERSLIAAQLADLASDRQLTVLRLTTLDVEVRALRGRVDAAERQININTGKLEQGAAWRSR